MEKENQQQEVEKQINDLDINDNKEQEENKIENEQENDCYDTMEEFFLDSVRLGDIDDIKECLNGEEKIDVTWFDKYLNNALHMIAGNGHIEILDIIFEYIEKQQWSEEKLNKFLNQQNSDGQTALHFAAFCDKKEICQYLVDKKASCDIKNQIDNTPFDEAMALENFDIAEILAKHTKGDMEGEEYQDLPEIEQVKATKDDVAGLDEETKKNDSEN